MTMKGLSSEHRAVVAARTLALLNGQTERVRAQLVRLRRELGRVQQHFSATRDDQLLKANEQLVLAALEAETLAAAATVKLEELASSSQRDTLTDTLGRALMEDRIDNAIALARRRDTRVAVLFVDLDQFKPINDTLGHAVGDAALQLAARRLQAAVRDSDSVSRYGGDEFLVLLAEVAQTADAAQLAAKIAAGLAAPSMIGEHILNLSASIGIAFYPDDGDDAATLIGCADAAMYSSKRVRCGGFALHRDAITSEHTVASQPSAEPAIANPAGQDALLSEIVEQLVIATLAAQERQDAAVVAHRRQMGFMATVAHELRNPLNPIRIATQLLDHASTDAVLLAELRVMIDRQVTHMSRLIEDLLDATRVGVGSFQLNRSAVEVIGLLRLVAASGRTVLQERQQHFVLDVPTGRLFVHGDAMRLTQVFSNLLDNASKYTPSGGTIALRLSACDDLLTVAVVDNGIGISAEALSTIFDLFVQEPIAPRFNSTGLGIGLAVVRDLVEAHGGHVVAISAGRDRGSEFVVTLPRIAAPIVMLVK